MIRLIFILATLLLFPAFAGATQIQVDYEPDPVSLDEAFQLTFTANGTTDGKPDFSVLERDFDILSQRQSSQSSWVNGSATQSITWTLNVMARQPGKVTIPAIKFGGDASQSLEIVVHKAKEDAGSERLLFLEVEAGPEKPFLQTQLIYTWRFFRRVEVASASLSEPGVENAMLVKLGENRQYSTQIEGVNYAVTEGRYAIFPQQVGPLTISPLVLTAEVVSNSAQNRNRFFRFQNTTTKRAVSDAITLQVQAIPNTFTATNWLGAEQLELSETWSAEGFKVKVGEPLTRTLTLRAVGVLKGQLPELKSELNVADLKTYADQPVLAEQLYENGVSALREQKIAIIASTAGEYILPAIVIPWFNIRTGETEFARLPEVKLRAIADPEAANIQATPVVEQMDSVVQAQQLQMIAQDSKALLIWKGLAFLAAAGWGMTLFLFWWKRRSKGPHQTRPMGDQEQLNRAAGRALKTACRENQAQAAKLALLKWGEHQFNASSLVAIGAYCAPPMQHEIEHLNRILYAAEPGQWQGDALWKAFTENQDNRGPDVAKESSLERLYPLETTAPS